MQTSRVNGLTSGVFAFLVPASCHLPVFVTKTPGAGENLLFPVSGGTTEHCERVSYDVPVIADQPLLYS